MKEHKLVCIDLDDLTTKEMNLDERVFSSAYLQIGILILGGKCLSTWMIDKLPFNRIKCVKWTDSKLPIETLAPLSGDVFAGHIDFNVVILKSSSSSSSSNL